jgi:hypothetical protein
MMCKCGHSEDFHSPDGCMADAENGPFLERCKCEGYRPASLEAKACKECGHYPHGLMCCVGVPKPNGLSRMCGCTHGVEKK